MGCRTLPDHKLNIEVRFCRAWALTGATLLRWEGD